MSADGSATETDLIPPYLRLLWHGEDDTRPGPKRGIDLRTLGAAGVALADAEGIGALSMRRLATGLGFSSMALYRYVESKTELLTLITDHAYGTPDRSLAVGGEWRSTLATWAAANRQILLDHPWILQIPLSEPPLAPNQIGWMEVGLQALAGTPLSAQEKLSSLLLVEVFVRGQVQLSAGMEPAAGDLDAGTRLYARRLRQLTDPDHFPEINAALESGALDDDPDQSDGSDQTFSADEFAFGLETVLDGIARRIARHT